MERGHALVSRFAVTSSALTTGSDGTPGRSCDHFENAPSHASILSNLILGLLKNCHRRHRPYHSRRLRPGGSNGRLSQRAGACGYGPGRSQSSDFFFFCALHLLYSKSHHASWSSLQTGSRVRCHSSICRSERLSSADARGAGEPFFFELRGHVERG